MAEASCKLYKTWTGTRAIVNFARMNKRTKQSFWSRGLRARIGSFTGS